MKKGLMRTPATLWEKSKPLNEATEIAKPDIVRMPLNLLPQFLRAFSHHWMVPYTAPSFKKKLEKDKNDPFVIRACECYF